jgi:hypothetical protein
MTSRKMMTAYLFVASLAASAATAGAQEVTVQHDPQADFSGHATYAWTEGQPAQNPFADRSIVEAIDRALAGKGWRRVEREASYVVRYQASVREDKSLQVGDGRRPFFGGMSSVDVKTVVNGMLVVDIADAAGRVIWRAVARDTVSDKPEKNQKKLAKAMDRMFESFPPAAAR